MLNGGNEINKLLHDNSFNKYLLSPYCKQPVPTWILEVKHLKIKTWAPALI